jgi:hypothetical protein
MTLGIITLFRWSAAILSVILLCDHMLSDLMLIAIMLSAILLIVHLLSDLMLGVILLAKCHYAECRNLFMLMLSVILLSDLTLIVIMVSTLW